VATGGANTESEYVSDDQLRVGLYVFIDLPWFQHPFTLNSFRITSLEQVATLRALGERRFRYDPERSDAAQPARGAGEAESTVAAPASGAASAACTANDAMAPMRALDALPVAADGRVPSAVGARAYPTDAEPVWRARSPADAARADAQSSRPASYGEHLARSTRQARMQALSERRLRIAQVDKAFFKSSGILRHLNRNLADKPNETLQEMALLVEPMVDAFLENPEVTLHVMGEKCGGEEIHSHCLNVSVLSMMLTKALDFSAEQARMLGLGALLHDIGLNEVPDRIVRKRPDEYTRAERELRAMHCAYGLRLGKQLGLPSDVLAIIYQHHEMADGSGYPLGLKLDAIALPARVVALANCFDNLCNPFDIAQAMTPHDALSLLYAQRRGKFDEIIVQQLIRCLGVYPPGSIVALSNNAIAMVMSVNPAKPLRPWVMLYDERVPKDEALLLDLEQESDIAIAKSLRPAALTPMTRAYLSPRKRVSYFFDSSTPATAGAE